MNTTSEIAEYSPEDLIAAHRVLNKLSGAKSHQATNDQKRQKLLLKDEIARRARNGCPVCKDYLPPATESSADAAVVDVMLRPATLAEDAESVSAASILEFPRSGADRFEHVADITKRVVAAVTAKRG